MSDQPDLTAPSPADGPTIPGRGAVTRSGTAEGDAAIDGGGTAGAGSGAGGTGGGGAEGVTDPATTPGTAGPAGPGPVERPTDRLGPATTRRPKGPGRTRMSGTWVGLILGAVVLVFLLIFILQNPTPAEVGFLGMRGTLPLGIWLLFAAIAGVLLLAIPGLGRMVQWRRATRRRGGRMAR